MSVEQEPVSGVGAPLGNDNAVENSGGGAPLGNSNAVGNSGGGAPKCNTNRKSHGVYCSLENIDERAEGETIEVIDEIEETIRERTTAELDELPREIPLRLIRHDRAVRDIQNRGVILDDGSVNPMVSKSRRILDNIIDDLCKMEVI
ncbi:hypothetical protein [Halorubrum aethiopicum]|uniref:hypothetical protein n=1 Tax=Halorubrum aethiopicum TaxID=1758255 RepID=UPI000AF4F261|nr:hypothetical protein [Halorubrum aethiopicum]